MLQRNFGDENRGLFRAPSGMIADVRRTQVITSDFHNPDKKLRTLANRDTCGTVVRASGGQKRRWFYAAFPQSTPGRTKLFTVLSTMLERKNLQYLDRDRVSKTSLQISPETKHRRRDLFRCARFDGLEVLYFVAHAPRQAMKASLYRWIRRKN